jgi:GDPmannose 4,6-dehydratase
MRALIFGVAGQDGSYLAEFLLSKGYDVLGATRFHASDGVGPHLALAVNQGMSLTNIDLLDASNVLEVVARFHPDEVYNLAAQSYVGSSWDAPSYVLGVNTVGVSTILEACRVVSKDIRIYQASSSEMYGNRLGSPTQTLDTMLMADDLMVPRSPYGISKLGAHHLCRVYRESHGMFAVGGICFNHESERRGLQFVTRKVTMGMALVKAGRADKFPIGTLDACRDWGYAAEYVVGMWKMLQQETPKDYVLATGVSHSVRELVNVAALAMDMPKPGEEYVEVVPSLIRPAEIWRLVGDTLPARQGLGWEAKVGFEELIGIMAEADLARLGMPPVTIRKPYTELEAWSASGPSTAE